MNVPVKLAAFATLLVVAFGAAYGIGAAVGPVNEPASGEHGTHTTPPQGDDMQTMDHAAMSPAGLETTASGYSFEPLDTSFEPAADATFRFQIVDSMGAPVTRFQDEHDRPLHLIVVRRDLSGYQHVHPTLDADGTWKVQLDLSTPGRYRALADFTPNDGEGLTLGQDLTVSGAAEAVALPTPARSFSVDGYDVELSGDVVAGREAELDLRVTKAGKPVEDLQPYLAAYGHLVALRSGDLAYLHVHPAGEPGDGTTRPGPVVTFFAQVPSAGTYRLYFDFQHDGVVRTAEFTVEAQPADDSHSASDGAHQHGED